LVVRQRQGAAAGAEARTIDVLTEIATRFYLGEESQIEIARDLGLDPSTVSRYLKRAREEGIVHVEIRPPRRADVDLGREVAASYGLARVVVAPTDPDLDVSLGPVAAEFVDGLLRSGLRIGISWGRTLAAVVRHLRPAVVGNLSIAQLAGGVDDPTPGIQGHELVRRTAELFPGSRAHYLHAPAIVGSDDARRILLADRTVKAALDAARRSELALVGVGAMDEGSTLHMGGHVPPDDWARLLEAGAVGNVNTRFFDALGMPVELLDRRTIAITWDELRAIRTVVAVAAGTERAVAIGGALATGCIDILVTDGVTAEAMLRGDIGPGRLKATSRRRLANVDGRLR
jgi:DNA-binding transcriptional regulator LsrR (DeoR family)